ncbi:hypothetical protein H0H93_007570, partial [Arthromyces matolae]
SFLSNLQLLLPGNTHVHSGIKVKHFVADDESHHTATRPQVTVRRRLLPAYDMHDHFLNPREYAARLQGADVMLHFLLCTTRHNDEVVPYAHVVNVTVIAPPGSQPSTPRLKGRVPSNPYPIGDIRRQLATKDNLGDWHGGGDVWTAARITVGRLDGTTMEFLATSVHFGSLLQDVMDEPQNENQDDILEDSIHLRLRFPDHRESSLTLKRPATEIVSPSPKRARLVTAAGDGGQKRRNAHRHAKRAQQRVSLVDRQGHVPSQRTESRTIARALPRSSNLSLNERHVPHGAYVASNFKEMSVKDAQKAWTEEELINDHGFAAFDWDGIHPVALVDRDDRVYAVLTGRPDDSTYVSAADEVFELLMHEGRVHDLPEVGDVHKRGNFPVFNVGYTYGNGGQEPSVRKNGKFDAMLERIMNNGHMQRLTSYASSTLQLWAPRLHEYFDSKLAWFYDNWGTGTRRIFRKSVYPSAAFNMGGRVRTFVHRDVMNIPFGWCAITALGRFDPDKSAKLILWEPKLVVRFPHASTVQIPSATITHSNTGVTGIDLRLSVTQYAPGGLFRWIDNGGRTEAELRKADPDLYADMQQAKANRWHFGLGLLSTWAEIQDRVASRTGPVLRCEAESCSALDAV